MPNNSKVYVGIDVSKKQLDIFIHPNNKYLNFKNDSVDIRKVVKKLALFPDALIVMESTGGYEKKLAIACAKEELSVAVVNPRQVRDFAKAMGKLAKTDKIDAQVIALFAAKIEPKPNVSFDENLLLLNEHAARRRQILGMIVMEKNRIDKASKQQKKSIQRIIKALEKELETIDKENQKLIDKTPELAKKKEILMSAKGIAEITATALLANLPEIGSLNRKQIAALAGLAPFNRDSGTLKGKRTIWGGRTNVRKALYMPTLGAIKFNPKIRAFYLALCQSGKTKMTALIACMRKLLTILNAMVKNSQPWH